MKMPFLRLKTAILALLAILVFSATQPAFASESDTIKVEGAFNASEIILHDVKDDHQWHFTKHLVIPLPIIIYTSERGLDLFMSSNFYDEHHNTVEYNGYKLEHNHISMLGSEAHVLDLSITKNVAMLLITSSLLFLLLTAVARGYKKNKGKAPSGVQSFFEPIILFVRDEIVKPNIGVKKFEFYLPYMLTLFFFILFGNLLGLLPGAGNLTGNIAVTMTLAFLTFVITNLSGNKNYWGHVFWTPGVPLWLRVVILPVEVVGIFTKPFSLMIRLFVAITAGHIVILGIICLTFIFKSYAVGIGASLISVFINAIELLVAGIQAYVFTMFSSLYIGMAVEEHDHH